MTEYVLIVEDDDDFRDNLALLLQFKGHHVKAAAHGREALDTICSCGPPCLIILDLMMPVMNGWEFHAEIRAEDRLAGVPLIVLSGVTDVDRAARALQAVEHMRKPCDVDALCRIVDVHC